MYVSEKKDLPLQDGFAYHAMLKTQLQTMGDIFLDQKNLVFLHLLIN